MNPQGKTKIPFLYWKVLTYWDKWFRKQKKGFDSCVLLSLTKEKKADVLLEAMKASKKKRYQKRVIRYNRFLQEIEEHNDRVKEADVFKETFSFESLLKNPKAIDEITLQRIKQGRDVLSSFSKLSNEEKQILRDAEDVLYFYNLNFCPHIHTIE